AAPARVAQPGAAAVRFGAEPDASADEALREEPWPADAHSDDDDDARDDDSDDDAADITPTVQRFEPGLLAAEAKPKLQRFKTSKPSKIERFPSRVSILRPEPRPPGDIVYTEDDVMSPADYAAGFRRWAPPSPSQAGTGHFMAQARRRFEREWSMELEDVGLARAGAPDVEPKLAPRPSRASQSEELPKMPFVHQKGLRPIPKDHRGKSRILGRRPAKILKTKRVLSAVKALGLKYRTIRRRNLGRDLDWDEAKSKWMSWYEKNKKHRWRRIDLADSPKKADVDAVYEGHQARRLQRQQKLRARG
ncbi:Putative GTP-binding protein EngB, partial [Durusdinium trenchii]